jgi:hypothetical protein
MIPKTNTSIRDTTKSHYIFYITTLCSQLPSGKLKPKLTLPSSKKKKTAKKFNTNYSHPYVNQPYKKGTKNFGHIHTMIQQIYYIKKYFV